MTITPLGWCGVVGEVATHYREEMRVLLGNPGLVARVKFAPLRQLTSRCVDT